MKNIIAHGVRKPITVLMGVLIVIILGVISFTRLPVNLFPDIELPYIVVVTTSPGANPYTVEEQATKKVESAVMSVDGFKSLESTSSEHFSMVMARFSESANMDTAIFEVGQSLNMIDFADGVNEPLVLRFNPSMMPVISTSITKDFGPDKTDEENYELLSMYVEENVMQDLNEIDGIASPTASFADIQIKVEVDTNNSYGLTEEEILNEINGQNIEGVVGGILTEDGIRLLRIGDSIDSIETLQNLNIYYDSSTDTYVKLLEVADVKYVNVDTNSYYKVNGKPALVINFQKTSDANTLDAAANVTLKLDQLAKEHDFTYTHTLDQSEYISESINSVTTNLLIGGILAIFILFLFLRSIKPTIIIGIAIPLSVIIAFVLMYFAGVTLNIISLGGLALGIGMMVDNSIVVIENIFRLRKEGKSKKEAAIEGSFGVGMAITASTLTTVSVFIPIVFIEGMTRQLLQDLALTVTFSLIGSLIIALAVVPTMANTILTENTTVKEDLKIFTKLKAVVDKMLDKALRYRIPTVVLSLFILTISALITVKVVGFEMMPETDDGQVTVDIEMKKGTSFATTEEYLDYISEKIMQIEDIEVYSAEIGGDLMTMIFGGTQATDTALLSVVLKDNRENSTAENAEKIKEIIDSVNYEELTKVEESDIYKYSISSSSSGMSGGGPMASGGDINVIVKGNDLEKLEAASNDIVNIIKNVEGTENLDNGIKQGSPEIKLIIDSKQTLKYGITGKEVRDAITIFNRSMGIDFSQQTETVTIVVDGKTFVVDIASNNTGGGGMPILTPEQFLAMISVYSKEDTAQLLINPEYTATPIEGVNVASFGEIKEVTGFSSITRDGRSRLLNVTADSKNSKVTNKVESEVLKYTSSKEFADKYGNDITIKFAGTSEDTKAMVNDMMIVAVVAILLVFMIMAIQFQSLLDPLIVMITLPLAFTGGFLALLITGTALSMTSIMGLIVLTGVVVNNGIVMIDYINQKLKEGLEINQAIKEAVSVRLRPILMTALTTILALIPLALKIGEGSETLQPMAITTIGGLVYATILTLVVVPCFFSLANTRKAKKNKFVK